MISRFLNFRAIFRQPVTCVSCGKGTSYRVDKAYVLITEIIIVVGSVVGLFLTENGDFRTYTSQFSGFEHGLAHYSTLLLLVLLIGVGIYEFFVKKYEYHCDSCGHTYRVQSKVPLFLRIFILCMLAILFATPFLIIAANRYIEANKNPYSLRQ